MSKEELHYGLDKIAARLGVCRNKARDWCKKSLINAHRDGNEKNAPYYCIESELNEDIKSLPRRL